MDLEQYGGICWEPGDFDALGEEGPPPLTTNEIISLSRAILTSVSTKVANGASFSTVVSTTYSTALATPINQHEPMSCFEQKKANKVSSFASLRRARQQQASSAKLVIDQIPTI